MSSLAISIAGLIKDQKEAAIITPPESPSKESIIDLLTFLKKNTIAEPKTVIPQVKIVAIKACNIGDKFKNKLNIKSPIYHTQNHDISSNNNLM